MSLASPWKLGVSQTSLFRWVLRRSFLPLPRATRSKPNADDSDLKPEEAHENDLLSCLTPLGLENYEMQNLGVWSQNKHFNYQDSFYLISGFILKTAIKEECEFLLRRKETNLQSGKDNMGIQSGKEPFLICQPLIYYLFILQLSSMK